MTRVELIIRADGTARVTVKAGAENCTEVARTVAEALCGRDHPVRPQRRLEVCARPHPSR